MLSQGDDTTARKTAQLLVPLVANAAELVERALAPDESAHEVPFVRLPSRPDACCAVSVSAVRSSQPPAGLAMHTAEACSMQLVQPETPSRSSVEDDVALYEALLLKYAPRYVVQRCNSI